jgi:hypothetical protein
MADSFDWLRVNANPKLGFDADRVAGTAQHKSRRLVAGPQRKGIVTIRIRAAQEKTGPDAVAGHSLVKRFKNEDLLQHL